MQCVGSIIVAPLIKRYPTRTVLATAIFTFGLISAILLIVDAGTGGVLRFKTADGKTKYGRKCPLEVYQALADDPDQTGIPTDCSPSTSSLELVTVPLNSSAELSLVILSVEIRPSYVNGNTSGS